MRLLTLCWLVVLSIFVYTVHPAHAQSRGDRSREETRELVRRLDQERTREAGAFAARQRLPMRYRQPNGRYVQLIDVRNGRPVYVTAHNRVAAAITHTQALYPGHVLGLNLTGAGLKMGIWDEGHAFTEHQEFTDRVQTLDSGTPSDHSTHVAGTLIAKGIVQDAQGMAYDASLVSFQWDNDASEMEAEARSGLLLSNHSYGIIAGWYFGDIEGTGRDQWYWFGDEAVSAEEDYAFGRYDTEAVLYDGVTFANPYYLPVIAAGNDRGDTGPKNGTFRMLDREGNWVSSQSSTKFIPRDGGPDGYDSIAGAAVAKNVLTVGSIGTDQNGNYRISPFSSFGPVDDGRIKPDIVGLGENVFSSSIRGQKIGDGIYDWMTGTSMAAPNVAGSLLLLQQYYHQMNGTFMRAATLKGLAIHTATDMGPEGPDYQYGWGLLDIEKAARQITSSRLNPISIHENELENGFTFLRTLVVSEPGPLRVTLSWTDRPASVVSTLLDERSSRLRNDLDLRLINTKTGETHFPFILDPENPDRPAGTGDNFVDPVEQILIPHAEPGTYTLTVTHKGQLVGGESQPFSILASGASDAMQIVSVGNLDASSTVDQVILNWNTFFEREIGSFQIERTPIRMGINSDKEFGSPVIVGTIEAAGSSEEERSYTFQDNSVLSGRYLYRIIYNSGSIPYVTSELEVLVPTPERFATVANYPNPFSESTTIVLDLPDPRTLKVEVYDILGRRVAEVLDSALPAGRHQLPVDASGWPAGSYFARITTRSGVITHQMIVVR